MCIIGTTTSEQLARQLYFIKIVVVLMLNSESQRNFLSQRTLHIFLFALNFNDIHNLIMRFLDGQGFSNKSVWLVPFPKMKSYQLWNGTLTHCMHALLGVSKGMTPKKNFEFNCHLQ